MKKIFLISFAIISIVLHTNQNAYSDNEAYKTTASGNYDWEDPSNWIRSNGNREMELLT